MDNLYGKMLETIKDILSKTDSELVFFQKETARQSKHWRVFAKRSEQTYDYIMAELWEVINDVAVEELKKRGLEVV
jgi:hypothetical protein